MYWWMAGALQADAERDLCYTRGVAHILHKRSAENATIISILGITSADVALIFASIVEQSPIIQTSIAHKCLREVEFRAVVGVVGVFGIGCRNRSWDVAILYAYSDLGACCRFGRQVCCCATSTKTLCASDDITSPGAVVEVLCIEQILVRLIGDCSQVENFASLDGVAATISLFDLSESAEFHLRA